MFGKILLSALLAAGVVFLLWLLRGAMLTPVRLGRFTKLTVTMTVTGPEPGLEETLRGLMWLRENGTVPAGVVIVDAGMDEDTRLMARLAAKDRAGVTLRLREDTEEWKNEAQTSK